MITQYTIFLESKNYPELYHSIRISNVDDAIKQLPDILENGLLFVKDKSADLVITASQRNNQKPPFRFLQKDQYKYFISTTRNIEYGKEYNITFVLDGEKISEKWKIEPYSLGGWSRQDWPTPKYNPNRNRVAEEKICSRIPEYLGTQYFKRIILRDCNTDIIEAVKGANIHNIKIEIE